MKATTLTLRKPRSELAGSWLDRLARRVMLQRLESLARGRLVIEAGGEQLCFGDGLGDTVKVEVLDPGLYRELVFGGSIGAGEAYMRGDWRCDDLTALVQLLLRNRELLDGLDAGPLYLQGPLNRLKHSLRRNTKSGSRRNIEAHYDLGNDLFALFLDPTMMYSSAIFERPDVDLHQGSLAKLERICRKLDLGPDDHLLEIGTGWGGMALYAAEHFGCRVTTTTISQEQCQLARQRVAEAGLGDRVEVLCQDYRELEGRYDKLVSIEMIEAIGADYLPQYFAQCDRLLKPEGMALVQAITIADQRYRQALGAVDFIQRYIFPGGFLPSVTALCQAITGHSQMRLFNLEDIGPHYATTLRHWRERFQARLDQVRALGYDEAFIRMWEFYLCYCEGGFLERSIGTVQMLLVKPECRRPALTPLLQEMSV
jgi:cyclopropane-fatty-acyl-phospholipid synthase